jgi:hypothetical protein
MSYGSDMRIFFQFIDKRTPIESSIYHFISILYVRMIEKEIFLFFGVKLDGI